MNNNPNNDNGLNGQVLGNVNSGVNPIPQEQPQTQVQSEPLETLNADSNVVMNNTVLNNDNLNNNNLNTNAVNNQSVMQNPVNAGVEPQVMVQPEVVPTPTPTTTPEPAYTNPQNINSMPGFENPNQIGTTPPTSLEKEKKPKKKQNKTLFVILIIAVLFAIGYGTYYVLQYTDLLSNEPQIVIDTKDLEVNMGDVLSTTITDYATITGTDAKNCSLSTTDVNTTVAGEYNYQITCGEIQKSGKVTVIDNRELEVTVKKVYKVKGDTVDVNEFIDNPVEGYVYEFVEPETVQNYLAGENGTYTVKVKATSGAKSIEVDAELVILQYPVRGYITCSSKEQNVIEAGAVMTVQEKFALLNDGNNGFAEITTETTTFKFTDETKYNEYLTKYNTEGTITINNVTGNPKFDDSTLTITIEKDRDQNDVNAEYGETNLANYSSIKTHFETVLGYTCKYDKSE